MIMEGDLKIMMKKSRNHDGEAVPKQTHSDKIVISRIFNPSKFSKIKHLLAKRAVWEKECKRRVTKKSNITVSIEPIVWNYESFASLANEATRMSFGLLLLGDAIVVAKEICYLLGPVKTYNNFKIDTSAVLVPGEDQNIKVCSVRIYGLDDCVPLETDAILTLMWAEISKKHTIISAI